MSNAGSDQGVSDPNNVPVMYGGMASGAVAGFGPYPQDMTCPHCNASITTTTKETPGLLTFLVCGGLCLMGLTLGCCLYPFCITGLKDIEHHCPNCNRHLGTYKRM